MNNKHIAIHEAAHAVFAFRLKIVPVRVYLYEESYNNKLGEMIPFSDEKYNILNQNKNTFDDDSIRKATIEATKSMLLTLIAGQCAENYFMNLPPPYPPDLRDNADGKSCYLIIEKLCNFHYGTFNRVMFNQIYYRLMNIVDDKIRSDKHLYDIIKIIANKLIKSKDGYLEFMQISRIIGFNLIIKVIFQRYRAYPFLDVDLIHELDNRNSTSR